MGVVAGIAAQSATSALQRPASVGITVSCSSHRLCPARSRPPTQAQLAESAEGGCTGGVAHQAVLVVVIVPVVQGFSRNAAVTDVIPRVRHEEVVADLVIESIDVGRAGSRREEDEYAPLVRCVRDVHRRPLEVGDAGCCSGEVAHHVVEVVELNDGDSVSGGAALAARERLHFVEQRLVQIAQQRGQRVGVIDISVSVLE